LFGRITDMTKKVWIISEIFHPEESATSHILTAIAKGLEDDFDINVITGLPDYSQKNINVKRVDKIGNISIERCFVPSINKNKIYLRIIRALLLSLAISFKALRRVKADDVVVVVTNPATILFFMSIVCRIKKSRFIILAHDIFPDNLVAARVLSDDSFLLRLLRTLGKTVYRSAQKVLVVGRDMGEVLSLRAGINGRIEVITNWADCDEVSPTEFEENPLVKKYNLKDKFVISFAGNIGRVQGIEYLLETMERLEGNGVHFLVVGDGAKKHLLDVAIENGRLSNVTLLGNRPRSEQKIFLNACHLGLVCLAPGMFGLGVPSKSYNIMAAGKPIIAAVEKDSEVGLMVAEEKIGWVVPPGQPRLLAEAILEAKEKIEYLGEMGRHARLIAEGKYSFQIVANRYKDILINLR
jgi:colanic acid biosynthesis glycosyl transferase WcaI